jgi:hypothetical protein
VKDFEKDMMIRVLYSERNMIGASIPEAWMHYRLGVGH